MKLTKKKFIAGLLTLAMAVTMIGLPFMARAVDDGGDCKVDTECTGGTSTCVGYTAATTEVAEVMGKCTAATIEGDGTDNVTALKASQSGFLNDFQGASGLGGGDLSTMIGKIVQAVLSLLGVVAVLIVLYGGFRWMTAGGDETKVDGAKKLIISGIIGLVIVVAAYAIASFVLTGLQGATK